MEFHPRTTIKAQALADFVVKAAYQGEEEEAQTRKITVDGSVALTESGADIVLKYPAGDTFEYAIKF